MSDTTLTARHCRRIAEAIEAAAAENPAWTWAAAQSVYGITVWARTKDYTSVDPAELADDVELLSVEWLDCDAICSAECYTPEELQAELAAWLERTRRYAGDPDPSDIVQ